MELYRRSNMGEEIFYSVASGVDVEFVLYMQLVELFVQGPCALVEAVTVLAAAIEVDLRACQLRDISFR